MAVANVNVVVITGNLTRDPDLRHLENGSAVCRLRVAVNTRRKSGGEWIDKPNYFDVVVWGEQGKKAAKYLHIGRPVAIEGRLEWREWKDQDDNNRQSVEIVANTVQFLNAREASKGSAAEESEPGEPEGEPELAGVASRASEDDIPF